MFCPSPLWLFLSFVNEESAYFLHEILIPPHEGVEI
jgi:hypothetical protein